MLKKKVVGDLNVGGLEGVTEERLYGFGMWRNMLSASLNCLVWFPNSKICYLILN